MELNWHKSSHSTGANECVEVAETPQGAKVRDTRNRSAGHLSVPPDEWSAFLTEVRAGLL
ncbi:DUF397 domain-containing protein [Nocardiopsis composta]|uniref:DUF397 domain-containing protein n=1 Tax=Nocardiopsis composta TaxID=157465 RepID=A0A7W8QQQ9_9ACTN|nr:DUF397 domain-containing protein [Nocardiopsis composta]MBB5434848.1 hypothetical protein [Nocardiopsis composta]